MGERRSVAAGLALALAGGLMLVAAFPPVGAWPLIFVGFAPAAFAQHRLLPPRLAGLAVVLGPGLFIAVFTVPALLSAQRFALLLLVPVLWLTGNVERSWHDATDQRHLWWTLPVTWVAALFLLGHTALAGWIDPAYALFRQPWLIQAVSITGTPGLDLVVLLTSYLLVSVLLTSSRRARGYLLVGLVLVLGAWVVGSASLLGAGRSGTTIRVAAVQPGTTDVVRTTRSPLLAALVDGTRTAAREGAQLVVWPEKVVRDLDLARDPSPVAEVARETHTYVVVGYTPDERRYNRAIVIAPDGSVVLTYDKQHPVVFQGDHSEGGPVVLAATPLGRIAPIICYDLDFPSTARTAARRGAQLLAVPSEDWSGIARVHYTHLVFRAVETRLAAIKADVAWDSAVIDPNGRIVASHVTKDKTAAVVVADVRLGSGRSVYDSVGDIVGWACVLLTLGWFVIGLRANPPTRLRGRMRVPSPPRR